MPDTIRLPSEVLDLLPVNTAGDIGAQDLRDVVVSLYAGREANVLEYGADPTGVADSTAAFQAAIDDMAALGGGTVLIAQGEYLVWSLTLKNKVSLVALTNRSATIRAKSGTAVNGLIQLAPGPLVRTNLVNLNLVADASSAASWAIYAAATLPPSGTQHGGWWNSVIREVEIHDFNNGIWLRGGATGSSLPHQFLTLEQVVVERLAGVVGTGLRMTGQTNQVVMTNCLLQVAGSGTNRMGVSLEIGADPTWPTGFRYPQGLEANLVSMQGCDTACVITAGQNLTFTTPYVEKANKGFDIAGYNLTNAAENVVLQNPRFASIGEVTGGFLIKAGAYSRVHANDVWFAGSCAKPFVNADSRGFHVTGVARAGGNTGSSGLTEGMTATVGISGSGLDGVATLLGHRSVWIAGVVGKQLSRILSDLMPGESCFCEVVTKALTVVEPGYASGGVSPAPGANLALPYGLLSYTFAVGERFMICRSDHPAGSASTEEFFISFPPGGGTVAALAGGATLADTIAKLNQLIATLQTGSVLR